MRIGAGQGLSEDVWLRPAFHSAGEDGEDVDTNNWGHITNAHHKKAKVMSKNDSRAR